MAIQLRLAKQSAALQALNYLELHSEQCQAAVSFEAPKRRRWIDATLTILGVQKGIS